MAKPEDRGGSGCVGLITLGVAVAVALAAVSVCVMCLDARRREQLSQLTEQVDSLTQLINTMQSQLASFNNTVQARKMPKAEVNEEVIYEDEYEYDDENTSDYEETEDENKRTVKRTTILSQDVKNETKRERLRRRRAVPIREESEPTTDKIPHKLSPGPRSGHNPEYQELKRGQESVVRFRHGGVRHMSDIEMLAENSPEEFVPNQVSGDGSCQILAAHFVGDTSSYNTRDHPHYIGNSILHHGIFKDWVPADWMYDSHSNKHFPLKDGKVTVQRPGIYFVYAQVYYTGSHDRCGFHIKRNGTEVAQCMTTTTGRHMEKRNTCFTALVLHLQQFDTLSLTEVEGNRNTSFKSFHSYFGLVQLKQT